MRIIAYILMPNHWHLVLYPKKDANLGAFMHRLTNAHTRKVHAKTKTNGNGHLYQGRYKSFLVDKETYFLTLIKYVERNPVRAKLVHSCQDWQWGSAWRRIYGSKAKKLPIDRPPAPLPHGYAEWINTPDKEDDLVIIRNAVNKCMPYGRNRWVDYMVKKYDLGSTMRAPGRPRKK